jgi:hypothetical protein
MRERFECGVEVSRTASESFRGRCAQGVLDKSDDFKTATAQRSLDRFAVELTLFCMEVLAIVVDRAPEGGSG